MIKNIEGKMIGVNNISSFEAEYSISEVEGSTIIIKYNIVLDMNSGNKMTLCEKDYVLDVNKDDKVEDIVKRLNETEPLESMPFRRFTEDLFHFKSNDLLKSLDIRISREEKITPAYYPGIVGLVYFIENIKEVEEKHYMELFNAV